MSVALARGGVGVADQPVELSALEFDLLLFLADHPLTGGYPVIGAVATYHLDRAGQIPIGAGSFNSGPRPVMKWLDQYGDREIDEMVELVPYTQTREYMKKVTENYARYRYLYANEVYVQPFPPTGAKYQISTAGGRSAVARRVFGKRQIS